MAVSEHTKTSDKTEDVFLDNESITYESCEGIYILDSLKQRDSAVSTDLYIQGERICIHRGLMDAQFRRVSDLYDLNGVMIGEEENLPWFYDGETALFLSGEYDREKGHTILYLKDSAGTTVHEAELPYGMGMVEFYYLNDAYLALQIIDGSNRLYIVDSRLKNVLYTELPHVITRVIAASAHEILIQCYNNTVYRYDISTQACTEITPYTETAVSRKAEEVLISADGTYFILPDGIYVQRDGVDTLLCDFARSYYTSDELRVAGILPGDRFLVVFTDAFTGESYPAIFAPTEDVERPVRKTLRVASIGNHVGDNDDDHRNAVNSVAYFNRNNEDYVIELTDYDVIAQYNADGTPFQPMTQIDEHAVERFQRDLLDGVQYDVFLFGTQYSGFDDLASKGIFSDLSKIAGRTKLISCVEEALSQGGEILAIPFSVSLSTLLTTTDTLQMGETLTYDTMFAIRDSLADGEALFGQYAQRELSDIALTDFVDFENKTCSLDSDQFAQVLTFLSDYETSVFGGGNNLTHDCITPIFNNTYGMLNVGYSSMTVRGDLLTPFADGTVKFLQFDIGSPKAIPLFYYLEEMTGKELNICGYPTKDGGSIHMALGMRMAIRADSAEIRGAEKYVSLMLSEAVQTKVAQTAFPVIRKAVENTVDWGWQYFDTYSHVDNGPYRWDTVLNINFSGSSKLPADGRIPYSHEMQVLKPKYDAMLSYVCDSKMRTVGDETVRQIIDEELSAAVGGARSVSDAAKIIQSRVFIYINE